MNEKFTNGKWEANSATGTIYCKASGRAICLDSDMSYDEYNANMLLLTHAKDLYYALLEARVFVPTQKRKEIDNLLREINPDFDKRSEVTDIKKFAERVKNMREWQMVRECARLPINNTELTDTERYASGNEQLVDSIVAEILQEAENGKH